MNNIKTFRLYVDENMLRIIAAEVVALMTLTFFLHREFPLTSFWRLPALLLSSDFALRAFTHKPSPLALVADIIIRLTALKSKPVFATPKKFAACLGFVCSFSVLVLLWLKITTAAFIVAGLLMIAALLECAFKICLGCYVFNLFFNTDANEEHN